MGGGGTPEGRLVQLGEEQVPGMGRGVVLGRQDQQQAPQPLVATGCSLFRADVDGTPGLGLHFNLNGRPYPPMVLALDPMSMAEFGLAMVPEAVESLLEDYGPEEERVVELAVLPGSESSGGAGGSEAADAGA